jgi:hypothetical protein
MIPHRLRLLVLRRQTGVRGVVLWRDMVHVVVLLLLLLQRSRSRPPNDRR